MNSGRSLVELATELERQQNNKRDFITPTTRLHLNDESKLVIQSTLTHDDVFDVTRHAHSQIASHVGVPMPYYDRMKNEAPTLLARNVNHWMKNEQEMRMVRTLDGRARAFVSDRYRPFDNFDLAKAALPILTDSKNNLALEVMSSEVTENKMYIKVVSKKLERKLDRSSRVGDIVQVGITLSNGEIGNGSVRVEPFVYCLACLNGMISGTAMRKYHVGRQAADSIEAYEVFSTETKEADDRVLAMKIQDTLRAAFDQTRANALIDSLAQSVGIKIDAAPDKFVEVIVKQYRLTEDNKSGILRNLIEGGIGNTKWGLANAITSLANDERDYDRATELERIGGDVVQLPQIEWNRLNAAAA